MNKEQWREHHGFDLIDMSTIDECLLFGGKITAIWERPLGYEIICYNKNKY